MEKYTITITKELVAKYRKEHANDKPETSKQIQLIDISRK